MATLTLIEHNGTQHTVGIEPGKTLMELATENAVPGIDADCGGGCACGTCHVIVNPEWFAATGTAQDDELQLLSMTPEREDTSRLACQIEATADMHGMVVHLPEFQM